MENYWTASPNKINEMGATKKKCNSLLEIMMYV